MSIIWLGALGFEVGAGSLKRDCYDVYSIKKSGLLLFYIIWLYSASNYLSAETGSETGLDGISSPGVKLRVSVLGSEHELLTSFELGARTSVAVVC